MSLPQSAIRIARNLAASRKLTAARRTDWLSRLRDQSETLWPELRDHSTVHLDHQLRSGAEGSLVSGHVQDKAGKSQFWIKWSPDGDKTAMQKTHDWMRWWRTKHPVLCRHVPRILDYWPSENVLIWEHAPGTPLARWLSAIKSAKPSDSFRAEQAAARLGAWLNGFARGQSHYNADVAEIAAPQVTRQPNGQLRVNARELMLGRIDRATGHVLELAACGFDVNYRWENLEPLSVASTVGVDEPAGFVHGDLKPENILCDRESFHVIDWWLAPRVSWPLPDIAVFAANLRMMENQTIALRAWSRFINAYLDSRMFETQCRQINLLAVMTGLAYLAESMRRKAARFFQRDRCAAMLDRLFANISIGAQTQILNRPVWQ